MSTFAYSGYQGKEQGLLKIMLQLGWMPDTESPDLYLIDFDGPHRYRTQIEAYLARGSKVAIYPHGAVSHLAWDGLHPVHPGISGYLAQSRGQAGVMHRYGYPHPVYITGWHWSRILPMREPQHAHKDHRVLFAPIHPLGNGYLAPPHRDANRRAFEDILLHWSPAQISVRCIGTPEQCGIEQVPGVEYHPGDLVISNADILRSDVVVSYGTFAHLAIASGVPTVMIGQDYPLGDGESDADWREVGSWGAYADYMSYPVQRPWDLPGSHEAVLAWRELFIGEPANPTTVASALAQLMAGVDARAAVFTEEMLP